MNRLGLVWLWCVMFCAAAWAEEDFSRPHNYLGFSDKNGRVCLWNEVYEISLRDGSSVPFRLKFSPANPSGAPLFGRFWWCPVLEATLIPGNERYMVMSTLGGRLVYLHLRKDGTYSTGNGGYKARIVSPSETSVTGEGWEFRFVSGKLRNAKSPGGVDLEWVYEGSKLLGVREKDRVMLLSLEYVANQPLPVAMVIGKVRFDLAYQQMPIATVVAGMPVITGYETSLSAYRWQNASHEFEVAVDKDAKYVMNYRSNRYPSRRLVWDPPSGQIQSDGEWTYTATQGEEENFVRVSRKNASGAEESYFYDRSKGASEHRKPDGTVVSRLYFIASGPTQFKIRKLTKTKDGKEIGGVSWSYDEMGRLIRERDGDYERSWTWRPDGGLNAVRETSAGTLLEETVYDEHQRLVSRTVKNKTYRYSYEGDRTIVQRLVDGNLASTAVIAPDRKPVVFYGDDRSGKGLQSAVDTMAKITPQEIQNAQQLALRALQMNSNDNEN